MEKVTKSETGAAPGVQVMAAAALIVCLLAGLVCGSALTARAMARQATAAAPLAVAETAAPVAAHRRLVEAGDTLFGISLEEGVPMSVLVGANPSIEDVNLIYAGTYLEVPAH